MKKRWLPDWVSEYRDPYGKPRYRFRRKGFAQYLFKSAPGTEAFRQEYEACKQGIVAEPIAAGIERAKPGSFDELIGRYYRSADFLNPVNALRPSIVARSSVGGQNMAPRWSVTWSRGTCAT